MGKIRDSLDDFNHSPDFFRYSCSDTLVLPENYWHDKERYIFIGKLSERFG